MDNPSSYIIAQKGSLCKYVKGVFLSKIGYFFVKKNLSKAKKEAQRREFSFYLLCFLN